MTTSRTDRLHWHVERTTTDKLADVLEGAAPGDVVKLTHTGGRDWVVVLNHADHVHRHDAHVTADELEPDDDVVFHPAIGRRDLNRLRQALRHSRAHDLTPWEVVEVAAHQLERVISRPTPTPVPYPDVLPLPGGDGTMTIGRRVLLRNDVGAASFGLEVGRYATPTSAGFDGWVEDERHTWLIYLGARGVPALYWPRRDGDGRVLGDPVDLR